MLQASITIPMARQSETYFEHLNIILKLLSTILDNATRALAVIQHYSWDCEHSEQADERHAMTDSHTSTCRFLMGCLFTSTMVDRTPSCSSRHLLFATTSYGVLPMFYQLLRAFIT